MRVIVHQHTPQRAAPLISGLFSGVRSYAAVLVWVIMSILTIVGYARSMEPVPVTPQQREDALRRVISVGGSVSMRKREIHHGVVFDNLPPALSSEIAKSAMASRKDIPLYTHNPTFGPENAPVTIIEMTDLSCRPCMDVVKAVDNVSAQFGDEVRLVHKYLPTDIYNPTNTAAIFGKLAQKEGKFWEYRHRLRDLETIEETTYNDQLIKLGVELPNVQHEIRDNARQFYRELDADALQAKELGETAPPALYVNGVKVGAGAVPLSALTDLVKYELERLHTAQMPHSPRGRSGHGR